jgi:hypothetical protein
MVDITTLQANPIPQTILELQSANKVLGKNNDALKNALIFFGAVGAIYVAYRILTYIQESNGRKNQVQYPDDTASD